MILIKDRRFQWEDGEILCRRNRRDRGIGGVTRQPVSISDGLQLSEALM